MAYLHIIEPRVKGNVVIHEGQGAIASERLRKVFKGKIIAAGGFEPDTAETAVEDGIVDAVAFGRHFLPTPICPGGSRKHFRSQTTIAVRFIPSTPRAIQITPSTERAAQMRVSPQRPKPDDAVKSVTSEARGAACPWSNRECYEESNT